MSGTCHILASRMSATALHRLTSRKISFCFTRVYKLTMFLVSVDSETTNPKSTSTRTKPSAPPPPMHCAQLWGVIAAPHGRSGRRGAVPAQSAPAAQHNSGPAPPSAAPVAPAEAHTRPHTTTSHPTPPHTSPSAPARHHTWAWMKSTYKNRFKQAKGDLNK